MPGTPTEMPEVEACVNDSPLNIAVYQITVRPAAMPKPRNRFSFGREAVASVIESAVRNSGRQRP